MMVTYFALELFDAKDDKPEEDVVASLLGVLGYAAQTLALHPSARTAKHMTRYLRSERLRIIRR